MIKPERNNLKDLETEDSGRRIGTIIPFPHPKKSGNIQANTGRGN